MRNGIGPHAGLLLTGRVVTVDALLSQREIAQTILDGGGDYVMLITENHPRVHADIALLCASPPPPPTHPGRWPRRESTATAASKSGG